MQYVSFIRILLCQFLFKQPSVNKIRYCYNFLVLIIQIFLGITLLNACKYFPGKPPIDKGKFAYGMAIINTVQRTNVQSFYHPTYIHLISNAVVK